LRVVSPNPRAIAQACCRHLRREGMVRAQGEPLLAILRGPGIGDVHHSGIRQLFGYVLKADCYAG
jgi:hypothetical protein